MPRHGMAAATGTQEPAAAPEPRRRRGLSAWPIRRKLVALVAGPLIVILAAGAFITAQTVSQLRDSQRSQALASAALQTSTLGSRLQRELSQTILAMPAQSRRGAVPPAQRQAVQRLRQQTDQALSSLIATLAEPPTGGWGGSVNDVLPGVQGISAILPSTRERALTIDPEQALTTTTVQYSYSVLLDEPRRLLAALAAELATSGSDGNTVEAASSLAALSSASAAAAQEIVDVNIALSEGRYTAVQGKSLTELKVQQATQLEIAYQYSTPAEQAAIDAVRADEQRIESFRLRALRVVGLLINDPEAPKNPAEQAKLQKEAAAVAPTFVAAASQRLQGIDRLVERVTITTRDRAEADARDALIRTVLASGLALLTLLLVTAFAAAIARTVSAPLRRLRAGAVEAATVRLPAAVRQIEREGPDTVVTLPPVLPEDSRGGPETLEVARAVDGLAGEAVRLASSQVRLRQALDEAFVSMSRRSQSMVEKQLAIIDELESTEEDPDQLRNLFRLDHLAARMRRYNDNLLVLAGSAVRTRSTAPVPIADVFRAATSEMEQYERVRLQPVGGAAVSGPAAGGLIHLLAELLDNAAMYSPPTSPILMSAAFTADGGLQLEITDSGVGIPPNELSDLNARLALPGAIDTQVPSRMGLFVVARLAQRGGFTVRLAPRPHVAGTVAEVLVPASLVIGAPATAAEAPGAARQENGPSATRVGAPVAQGSSSLAAALEATGLTGTNGAGSRPRERAAAATGGPAPGSLAALASSGLLGGDGSGPTGAAGAGPAGAGHVRAGSTSGPVVATAQPAPGGGTSAGGSGSGGTGSGGNGSDAAPPARTSGLPSRRPGAALSGGPLAPGATPLGAATPLGMGAGGRATPPSPFDTPASAPRAGSGATAAWRPRSSTPGSSPLDPAGPPTADRTPVTGAAGTAESSATTTGEHVPFGVAATSPSPFASVSSEDGDSSATALPRRAAAGAPGGASAATAAAAAAAARRGLANRPVGPTPGSGLFTARGPAGAATSGSATPAGGGTPPSGTTAGGGTPSSGTAAGGGTPSGAASGVVGSLPSARGGVGADADGPVSPAVGLPAGSGRPQDAGTSGSRTTTGSVGTSGGSDSGSDSGNGSGNGAPAAWDEALPTELAARAAATSASTRYRPVDPSAPLIGADTAADVPTPIFDTVSVWFTGETPAVPKDRVIDLRDGATPVPAGGGRWSALADQRWQATNARAAASPEVAGRTEVGLPRRRPGANLLPSAASAAPVAPPARRADPTRRPDADAVRGRLGDYQRGLSSARRARHLPSGNGADGMFTTPRSGDAETGRKPGDQGGDQ